MMTLLTFKYRLYPSRAQQRVLHNTLDWCRWVYNNTLAARKTAWEDDGVTVSCHATIKRLPGLKTEYPELKRMYSQVLQNVCVRVDRAFQAFFRRMQAGETPGYPRFKGAGWYDSFTYPQAGSAFYVTEDGKRLHLAKIGDVKIKLHRPIRGTIKTVTIRRDRLGHWYACLACEVAPVPLPPVARQVGVDVGIHTFAMLSDGEAIPNPRFLARDSQALARAQRRLANCEPGTPGYEQRKRHAARLHQRIVNRRRDFAHKVSRYLVNTCQLIVFEDLNIQAMQGHNHRQLNRSMADAAWYQVRTFTVYKAESAGRQCIVVDPRHTSQRCSECGRIVRKPLSDRVHRCPHCALAIDRDLNAARNILGLGMQTLALDA